MKQQPLQRTVAQVHLDTLQRNLRRLSALARERANNWKGAVPMVKDNAYGHGLIESARTFARQNETLALGVATLDEGVRLRTAGIRKPIWVFSECTPWNETVAAGVLKYRLTPVLHTLEDVQTLLHPRYRKARDSLKVHLKFNTGMNRLGICPGDIARVRQLASGGLNVEGICSHLASSEDPNALVTRQQLQRFRETVGLFSGLNVSYIHCANTIGILRDRQLGLSAFCNVIRPGIGLYGYAGAEGYRNGLRPALHWRAKILAVRQVECGEYVGYGASYQATRPTWQAVLGVGYGDGFRRDLSNKPVVVHLGARAYRTTVLGMVSMDLMTIGLKSKPGNWVTLLGEDEVQGRRLAGNAGTIIYEILTGISARVPRMYL